MAEGSSSSKGFAKVFSRKVIRTKEKVFQSIGKADKTRDEVFDEHVANVNKQFASATKLQKELKNYIATVRAMSGSSKAYYESIKESYDPEWIGYTELVSAIEHLAQLWDNYLETIQESLSHDLQEYIAKFPEIKNKIAKRGRKLVDYDSARHNLDSLVNSKKPDQAKIFKAQEDLNEAKRIYEDMNNELHRELPALFESRISFLSAHYNTLFSVESRFQEESARLKSKMTEVAENLMKDSGLEHGIVHQVTHQPSIAFPAPHGTKNRPESNTEESRLNGEKINGEEPVGRSTFYNLHQEVNVAKDEHSSEEEERDEEDEDKEEEEPKESQPLPSPAPRQLSYQDENRNETKDPDHLFPPNNKSVNSQNGNDSKRSSTSSGHASRENTYENTQAGIQLSFSNLKKGRKSSLPFKIVKQPPNKLFLASRFMPDANAGESDDSSSPHMDVVLNEEPEKEATKVMEVESVEEEEESQKPEGAGVYSLATTTDDIYQVPKSNEKVGLPAGVLFQVIATHPYNGEDVDELTFESGDKINVIPFDDPEEQDDGWLMGIKVGSKEKGVFPENFTKRVD